MTARIAIERGLVHRYVEHDCQDRVVFLTFTDTARGALDLPGLKRQWLAMQKWLRRNWGGGQFAVVREFQSRGALHPHVFLEVSDQVADDLRDRESRASYQRRMKELRPAAQRIGFGQMVDAVTIKTMTEREKVARYGAKAIAGYATKEAAERFKRAGAKRVRPVSLSREWVTNGLAGVREELLGREQMGETRLGGTWERIPKPRTC